MTFVIVFGMMAIGLNIVAGFAGLLDLGYVAFYAIGAYTAAFFASPHFGSISIVLFSNVASGFPASICRSGWCYRRRRCRRVIRRTPRRSDAAAAWRLPGHP